MLLETVFWNKPLGLKVFKHTQEIADLTVVHGANQGVYNGFLFAGLIWGVFFCQKPFDKKVQYFFLACVVVAGIAGGVTINVRVFYLQGVPAIIAIISLYFTQKRKA